MSLTCEIKADREEVRGTFGYYATFAKAMKVKESSKERVNLDSCFKINYISNLSKDVIKKYF